MKLFPWVVLLFSVLVTKGQYHFTLQATTPKELNNRVIKFIIQDSYSNNKFQKTDSAIIKDNKFEFSGTLNTVSENAMLLIGNYEGFYNFVLDSGKNIIIISLIQKKALNYSNKLGNTKVIGSRSNLVHKKFNDLFTMYIQQYGKPIPGSPGAKELDIETTAELHKRELKILKDYPGLYYSLIAMYELRHQKVEPEDILPVFNALNEKMRSSPLGIELNGLLRQEINAKNTAKAGNKVPEFSIRRFDGPEFKSNSLIGKPYVIAFSATWCIPCHIQQKRLKALYDKYHSKGLEVVYFNLDDNVTKWKAQIETEHLTWINVSERTKFQDSQIAKKFYVQGIPLYLIVDKKGMIAYNADEINDDYLSLEKYILKVL